MELRHICLLYRAVDIDECMSHVRIVRPIDSQIPGHNHSIITSLSGGFRFIDVWRAILSFDLSLLLFVIREGTRQINHIPSLQLKFFRRESLSVECNTTEYFARIIRINNCSYSNF